MANTFFIPEINPISFRKIDVIDDKYNTIPFDLRPAEKTVNGCYYQKWKFIDLTTVQILSDYSPANNNLACTVYNAITGQVAGLAPITQVVTNIQNQTFQVYEIEFDFSDWGNGWFYAEITYTDQNGNDIRYQSQEWQTADDWKNTLLFEYKNSYNDFSAIFEKGLEFVFRVESMIRDYTPQFDDEVYIDQMHNATQLSSIPSKQFRLSTKNLPYWALRTVNWALNVDQKRIDGVYYEKTPGAKFDITRAEGYDYQSGAIDIVPVDNPFLRRLVINNMAGNSVSIYNKKLEYKNNTIDRTLSGVFIANTFLNRIDIINKNLSSFTMKVGTTPNGNDLAEKIVTSADQSPTILINHLFDSTETVYISGIAGSQLDLFVIYEQDDEPATNLGSGNTTFAIPKGTMGDYYEVNAGDLVADWDLASGLGKTGTKYENCAICDGRNGTPNMTDTYTIAVAIGNTAALKSIVGSNVTNLVRAQLPSTTIQFGTDNKGGSGGTRVLSSDFNGVNPVGSKTPVIELGGTADDIDNKPKSMYVLKYLAITD